MSEDSLNPLKRRQQSPKDEMLNATDQSTAGEASAAVESEFEARLRQLQPAECQIATARLMFEAGRIAGTRKPSHRSKWLWPASTAAALLVAVTSVALHWIGPSATEPQLQIAEQPAVDPQRQHHDSAHPQTAPTSGGIAATVNPPAPVVTDKPRPSRASWPHWEELLADQARYVAALPASADDVVRQSPHVQRSRMTHRELLKELRRDIPDLRFAHGWQDPRPRLWPVGEYGPAVNWGLGY